MHENLKLQCASKYTKFTWFGNCLKIQKSKMRYFSLTYFSNEIIEKIGECNSAKNDASVLLVCLYLLTEHEFSCGDYVRFIQIPDILFQTSSRFVD